MPGASANASRERDLLLRECRELMTREQFRIRPPRE